ncbi:MAG: efflux RND transporter periplasmic adaptor subunit [Anaerolineales bacterium]
MVQKSFCLISSAVILLVVIAVAAFYFRDTANAEQSDTTVVQTAKVRSGDMVITASGAGTVVPVSEVDLGFRSAGVVRELTVKVGDKVESGNTLARLEDNVQAQADFQALFTPSGVLQAEGDLANAQINLDDAISELTYLIGSDVYYAELKVAEAQVKLDTLKATSSTTPASLNDAAKALERAQSNLVYLQNIYSSEYGSPDVSDVTLARAKVESARVLVQDAQSALDIIKAGPYALKDPIAALGPKMQRLEQIRLAVQGTQLTAPFDGTITDLKAVAGQTVNTSPVLTIASTNDLLAHIYLDESDLGKVEVGKRVTITFDAYPDTPIDGKIILIEPSLQTIDGSSVVAAWASFDQPDFLVLSGMNLEAEVIAGESHGTLLVPKQALRELEAGSYAVFVVGLTGNLTLTPVEVGLVDYANAEILSGLKVGDVVSTGNVETK